MVKKLLLASAFCALAIPAYAQSLPSVVVTFTVTDQNLLAGIHYAASAYNASLPAVNDQNGQPISPNPGALTDAQYATWIGAQAAKDWGKQKAQADFMSGTITKAQLDSTIAAINALP